MTKKNSLTLGIILFVAVALAGYFVAAPKYQVNAYKKAAESKHNELHGKLDKVIAIQQSDMLVHYDPSYSTIKSDVEAGNQAVKAAEDALNTASKELTTFDKLPLTGWTGGYDGADKLKSEEESYIKTAQELIAETKALLVYMDKFAAVAKKGDEFETALHKTNRAETTEEYTVAIRDALKIIESALSEMEKFEAPESMKEMHLYAIKSAREGADIYKQIAAAIEAEDTEESMNAGDKLFEKSREAIKKTDKLSASFVRESKVRKTSDRITQLDRTIVGLLAAL